jgi:probable rRNA maturation factor
LNIFLADEQDEPLSIDTLTRLAELVLESEGLDDATEMTLMLVTDNVIAGYNQQFMERDGPTDVLAFPLEHSSPGNPPQRKLNGPPINLGDVIISPEYVGRQAAGNGSDANDELHLMVVHGTLHLLGYDHPDDATAEAMEQRERDLLTQVGRIRP